MGNREDLLAGAKQCLIEKGYSRTTARDIANASGVSLAGIGYHFKSKEALMNEALFEVMQEWGEELEATLAADVRADATPLERFEAAWDRVVESFEKLRPLWVTQFELLGQIDHVPEVREQLVRAIGEARLGLAELFEGVAQGTDPERERLTGTVYQAMLTGFLSQWLLDPDSALSGREVVAALRMIVNGSGSDDTSIP
ncbi:Transcriptional regulator, TetR family [[Actinomadura] parvosata subsp. kistnae]|uniref:TetR family transcriptional regulator n=1 Tax=[Actinomadura] parvosata subsp. kistnae TaxID=1909395 RepID=A0A1V0AAC6_9ACTN|nr:TetR/AcrR family transcriptional regulator [Nonomuraea sp. ATCC 55076]AQZ67151.1 TetR family transcriptional regulator [Nonomuraea sp. ATCC 55076]SPL94642.1 Transcriptional regulator, TetR family [Actinomadura parvosata subsp. kistnae]